jgi:hypothetical protein
MRRGATSTAQFHSGVAIGSQPTPSFRDAREARRPENPSVHALSGCMDSGFDANAPPRNDGATFRAGHYYSVATSGLILSILSPCFGQT